MSRVYSSRGARLSAPLCAQVQQGQQGDQQRPLAGGRGAAGVDDLQQPLCEPRTDTGWAGLVTVTIECCRDHRGTARLGTVCCLTKFGVVALTEVLAAELAADGSKVGASVLCPGTVRTNIHASSRNRPQHLHGGGLADVDISADDNPFYRWISPEDAGDVVVRAIKRGDLYALTHPEWYAMVEPRHQAIAAAFRLAAEGS